MSQNSDDLIDLEREVIRSEIDFIQFYDGQQELTEDLKLEGQVGVLDVNGCYFQGNIRKIDDEYFVHGQK